MVALVVGAAVGIGGVATGAIEVSSSETHAAESGPDGGPGSYSKGTEAGPGMSGDIAIDRVLDGLAGTSVSSAKLVDAPEESDTGAAWITVDLDGGSVGGPRDVWLGALVEGAVADLMRTNEATTRELVDGGTVTGHASDGTAVEHALGAGSMRGGQRFNSPDDDTVREHVAEVGQRFGVALKSLSVLHPLETAIAVTFVVPDDAEIDWTIDELLDALGQSPRALEGILIQLVSPSGEDLLTCGAAYRMGAGMLEFAPGPDERFGALHAGDAGGPAAGLSSARE